MRDFPEPREIERPWISGSTGCDHDWTDLLGLLLHRVVIDLLGLFRNAIMRHLIKFAGEICRMPMRKVTAMGEVHRQNLVPGLNGGEINGHVRLRTAMRLHIDVLR